MKTKKKILAAVLLAVLVCAVIGGVIWCITHFHFVDFHLYPKGMTVLDLRGQAISLEHYDKVQQKMPGTLIYWDIPFQGQSYPQDTKSLTVTTLTDKDLAVLAHFPNLEQVEAQACTDYAQLAQLKQQRPEVQVHYGVILGGESWSSDSTQITLGGIAQGELDDLPYLPRLEQVYVTKGSGNNLMELQQYCREHGIAFGIQVGEQTVPEDMQQVELLAIQQAELPLLKLLTNMKTLRLVDPVAEPESILALEQTYPGAQISWEWDVGGVRVTSEDTEIDLSKATLTSVEQVEQAMSYFPKAQKVFLGDCGLDNDELAAYRDRVRQDYKVVWIVHCGPYLPTRTDATSFMPGREGNVPRFWDEDTYNLRYCEDMIAIDVGHQGAVKNIGFVAYMPNLKYLILAHTNVQDITPISNCKNLVFLELDWSPIRDYTPLQGCTSLEDLNIGQSGADVTPLFEMPWLKNVWCIFRPGAAARLATALPNTHVVASGDATVDSGWRNLPNYFAMRDALGMYYMKW